MKKLTLLIMLTLLVAATSLASAREWKPGKIDLTSETKVSSKLGGEKSTLHYTIETENMIYFAEYTYKPGHHGDSEPPHILLVEPTKIAIEGKTAYVLDVTGKEVKLHIVKKTKK
jgi:hypothetical protein